MINSAALSAIPYTAVWISIHLQLGVNNAAIVLGEHSTCSSWVEDAECSAKSIRLELLIGLDIQASLGDSLDVMSMAEIVGVDDGLASGVRRVDVDAATAKRMHDDSDKRDEALSKERRCSSRVTFDTEIELLLVDLAAILRNSLLSKREQFGIAAKGLLPGGKGVCTASVVVQGLLASVPKRHLFRGKCSIALEDVILKVLANTGKVDNLLDASSCEDGFASDARLLEQWRALDGPSGEDNLTASFDDSSISKSDTGSDSLLFALGSTQVDLGHGGISSNLKLAGTTVADTLGAICSSVLTSEGLGLHHGLNHGLPVPSWVAQGFPAIIFGSGSAIVCHEVESGASAQDLASVDGPDSVIGASLGNGGEVPIVLCAQGRTLETGDIDLWLVKCSGTSLDEEDFGGWEAFAKASSDGYSCGAASDDNLTGEIKVRLHLETEPRLQLQQRQATTGV
ncbi:hypothetical protein HG531_001194 [Fusarium graminearum]|nr:hypothetical protein HG531_001194 [Fusarium graminearum]